ncbi:ester cyclase [Paraburkholderia tropica]|uniref:ester cyclase n=1 Tax=Paraburkholderia tropica TaxID=92647 RepID=UPI002AB69911|nr:ester cyclase [Paraburkholderia tropica]
MNQPQSPRTVIERYYDEVWEKRRPDEIPSLFAAGYVNHAGARGTLSGPEGIRTNYQSLVSAFPDVRFMLDDLLVDGAKVVVRYTMYGTHLGQFQEFAPSGRQVVVPGIGIYMVKDGQIQESWVVRDSLLLIRQLNGEILATKQF